MKPAPFAFAAALLWLSGCGGGGDHASSSCQTVGSSVGSGAVNISTDNLAAMVDGNLSTFATLYSTTPGTFVSAGGTNFPAGSNAGFFITPPPGTSATDITVSTYLLLDSSIVETATGPTLLVTKTSSDPASEYVSFVTKLPFNGVKLTINTVNAPSSAQYLIYEACGSATVR
jgi:hypothetical protein